MNIILFSADEVQLPLPCGDRRARHILQVLRLTPGASFDAGLVDGPRGKGTLQAVEANALRLSFTWQEEPPPLPPVYLLVGLPRPQTARDILREASSLGVSRIEFVRTEKSETGYARSSVWAPTEIERLVLAGTAQAFCTRRPQVRHGGSLGEAIAALPPAGLRAALDNYEATIPLADVAAPPRASVALALGAERGWSPGEREILRASGFVLAHLGSRVLRTETACIAALALLKAKCGWP